MVEEDTSTQQEATSASTESFKTALVFNAAVFGIELLVFTILRPYFKTIYEPRTFAPPKSKRIAPLGQGFLTWPWRVFKSDPEEIIHANGLDAYFFVRFLRMCVKILFPIWLVSWAALLPISSVNSQVGSNQGLDLFTFGNVRADQPERYAAHIALAWFFTLYILYVIRGELSHFVYKRQLFLISPEHAKSVMASTVLITGIPGPYQSSEKLHRLFKEIPGGVKQIWLNRQLKTLPELYERQVKATNKLEKAEFKLLKLATKAKAVADKKGVKVQDPEKVGAWEQEAYLPEGADRPHHKLGFLGLLGEKVDTIEWARKEIRETVDELDKGRRIIWKEGAPWDENRHTRKEADEARAEHADHAQDHEQGTSDADLDHTNLEDQSANARRGGLLDKVVGNVGNVGGKMKETLDLESGAQAQALEGEDAEKSAGMGSRLKNAAGIVPGAGKLLSDKPADDEYPILNSAFVTFNRQVGAHMASQVLLHSGPYRMTGKYLETAPADVIWDNLAMDVYAMKIRRTISWALTIGLIVIWAIPVAFIGSLSNIQRVCSTYSWLNWLCNLDDIVVGIIQGILPPVLLAVLFMLLPIILRTFAKFEGIPKSTLVELSLMTRYFIFQVIHGFLIVTLASGIISSLPNLAKDPASIPSLLAHELPKASTFFLTYVTLQGLSGTAGGFLQIVPLVIYYVKMFLLGSTPRSVFGIKFGSKSVAWGTLFPNTTLIIVIAFGYMIISPLINGLACMTFFLFYMLYKFLFLWVYQQSPSSETGGLFFPKAIQHLFVGLYVQHICLAALFFLARDENGSASAIPEGALMIVLVVITAGVQMVYNSSYRPLFHALPLSLSDKTYTPPPPKDLSASDVRHADRASTDDSGDAMMGGDNAQEAYDEDKYGYAHPSISRPQRIVWLPEDQLGLWRAEREGCRKEGVLADLGGHAKMNEKGKVDVEGPGPGERYEY